MRHRTQLTSRGGSALVLTALRALGTGAAQVVRAWDALAVVWLITMIVALPLTFVLGTQLRAALATPPPIDLSAEEIDANWWREYRAQATGLDGTFTPAVLGAIAPLERFSAVLDGTAPSPPVLAATAAYVALWALLWGGLLHRFHHGPSSARFFAWRAAVHHLPRFLGITLLASVLVALLYLTVHRLLFGPVYAAIAQAVDTQAASFAARVLLYVAFAALLAAVMLVADYSRIAVVVFGSRSVVDAIRAALLFMRRHLGTVLVLFLLSASVLGAALVVYALVDWQFRGWRSVLVGQAFVVLRLAMRLAAAASQVALVRTVT